jgi:hypothetical protein
MMASRNTNRSMRLMMQSSKDVSWIKLMGIDCKVGKKKKSKQKKKNGKRILQPLLVSSEEGLSDFVLIDSFDEK